MIRISDIIKMGGTPGSENEPAPLIKETQKQDIPNIAREVEAHRIETVGLYNRGVNLMKRLLEKAREGAEIRIGPIIDFVRTLVEVMLVQEDAQLIKFYEAVNPEDYLPHHCVNVSLLAAKMGIWLGLNKSDLMEVTMAAFLHDLGMVKVEKLVQKKGRLGLGERRQVNRHPRYSEHFLRKMGCLSEVGLKAVRDHHRKGARDTFSQIIGLSDVYEAITHPRLHKKAKAPHQAIGEIIEQETLSFQPQIMKVFVNNLGVYPVGSWVRLSTGEVGIVVDINKGYPLRPKVNVTFDHNGERLESSKHLDFMTESYFYIDGPLSAVDAERLKAKWEADKAGASG